MESAGVSVFSSQTSNINFQVVTLHVDITKLQTFTLQVQKKENFYEQTWWGKTIKD